MAKDQFWQGTKNGKAQIVMKHQYWQNINYKKMAKHKL
jgi:hypothetical protein